MPGKPRCAQPMPESTSPTSTKLPGDPDTIGPPLSPWQESVIGVSPSPAQKRRLVSTGTPAAPYSVEHVVGSTSGTVAFLSVLSKLADPDPSAGSSLMSPKPLTIRLAPALSAFQSVEWIGRIGWMLVGGEPGGSHSGVAPDRVTTATS